MKKLLVLLALCMVLSVVLVACTEDTPTDETTDVTTEAPGTDAPTEAPGTDDPTEGTTESPTTEEPTTEAPTTEAPTTQEPTTEVPVPDPDPVTTHLSFDELDKWIDISGDITNSANSLGSIFTPGQSAGWDKIATVDDYTIAYLRVWGWVGFFAEEVGEFGYQIDDQDPVFSADFAVVAGQDVVQAAAGTGAKCASRMTIMIPVRDLSGEHTIKALVKDAAGTIEELTVFTLNKAVDPDAPVFMLTPAVIAATGTGAPDVASATISEDGAYVTLVNGTVGDPYITFRQMGCNVRYVAVKYRTTVAGSGFNFFAASTGNDATGQGDQLAGQSYEADGMWHTVVTDLDPAEAINEEWALSFLRYDFYTNGTNQAIDVAYIAGFNSAEAAQAYFEKTLPAPDPGAITAPAQTFTPETFAQPTIEEIKAGYTYDIGAGQFFPTIAGDCTYADLTQLSEDAQAALQAAGFGQYAYYAKDHISIAPPMTGEKLIVTMKVFDVQGNMNNTNFLLLNMTGGQQNSAQVNPVVEADPEIAGLYTYTFTEIVPGGTDELKFYMTESLGFYVASVYVEVYIPGEDPNFTNLNFDSNIAGNFENSQADLDPSRSDLANLFDQMVHAAGDPMVVAYNGGNSFYRVAGFSAIHTRPSGNYAFTINVTGTAGTEGFAGWFVRGFQQAVEEKNFYGGDGNDNGGVSYGGSGIYLNYFARGLGHVVRINIKTYENGVWIPNIYYVSVESSEITVVDDGTVVTILAGGKKVATIEIFGTKDYGIDGVAADALAEKVVLTLADGTVAELANAAVAASVRSSDLGVATRTGVIEFNRISLKPAESVEIPADFYLPEEKDNLAEGKPASADSVENDTNIVSNATDGNAGTRWGATPTGEANLIVDLEAVYTLEEIVGSFENAGYDYEVSVSVDGENYEVVHSSAAHGGIVVRIPVNVDARYIKFTRLDDSAHPGSHWFSLWEVYAFGTLKA
ncbi:MAG: hypothetical protein E7581_02540 [Ruminococcaceae bacterium]|nr:hypothetical protein [Oscillospiraceae bacterium]